MFDFKIIIKKPLKAHSARESFEDEIFYFINEKIFPIIFLISRKTKFLSKDENIFCLLLEGEGNERQHFYLPKFVLRNQKLYPKKKTFNKNKR